MAILQRGRGKDKEAADRTRDSIGGGHSASNGRRGRAHTITLGKGNSVVLLTKPGDLCAKR